MRASQVSIHVEECSGRHSVVVAEIAVVVVVVAVEVVVAGCLAGWLVGR